MIARILTSLLLAAVLQPRNVLGGAAPGVIQDCNECPRMVALPDGWSAIGSPPDEAERHADEILQHTESIAGFAISETEITRGQFAAFVTATKRRTPRGCYTHGDGMDSTADLDAAASWRAPRFAQTDEHPVVCVSWQDTQDYVAWLTHKTGQHYRLLTDSEWEYAARGGTTSAYFWGAEADRGCGYMNGGDRSLARALPRWTETIRRDRAAGWTGARIFECDDGSAFTSAVRSYRPNSFGIYDVAGNVWEWVDNCRDAPATTPTKKSAAGQCAFRGVRGGSWDDWPLELRSADRHRTAADTRRNDVGFRVARGTSRLAR